MGKILLRKVKPRRIANAIFFPNLDLTFVNCRTTKDIEKTI